MNMNPCPPPLSTGILDPSLAEVNSWIELHPSLWKEVDLVKYCREINKKLGYRQATYQTLLMSIAKGLQSPETGNWIEVGQKFVNICSEMPDEIKNREIIDNFLRIIDMRLRALSLLEMKKDIEHTSDVESLLKLHAKLPDFVRPYKDCNLNDILIECQSLCLEQANLATFAKDHDLNFCQPKLTSPKTLKLINAEHEPKKRVYSVLSIDGGGIRGIIPARVLAEVEKITEKRIANLFDLIGGTSTGGILTLGLTKPSEMDPSLPAYTAQDMLNMYAMEHSAIFIKRDPAPPIAEKLRWDETIREKLYNSRYQDPTNFFNGKLGNSSLSTALTDVLITTNNFKNIIEKGGYITASSLLNTISVIASAFTKRIPDLISHESVGRTVHYFTRDHFKSISYSMEDLLIQNLMAHRDFSYYPGKFQSSNYAVPRVVMRRTFGLATAALATSAAPTYFPPIKIGGEIYMDGGILQNDPALPCFFEAVTKQSPRNLFMLSLGTGEDDLLSVDSQPSLVSLWFDTTQNRRHTEDILQNNLSFGAYHRLQYKFRDGAQPELDDMAAIPQLMEAGDALVEEEGDKIRMIAKILCPGCI